MNIALIGFGVMGKNHFRVLKNISDVKVVAICDPVLEEPEVDGVKVFKSISEATKVVDIDCAIVAAPTPLHEQISLEVIELGIDLLIEKPISQTVASGEKIASTISKKGVKCAIGHVERFNPVVETLKKEVVGKDIYSIGITRVGPFPPRMGNVGVLTDLSVHDLDLVRFISGREFSDVKIFKSRKIHNHFEDNAQISFMLEDSIVGNINTNWLTPFKKRRIEISCKEAFYDADLISQELMEYSAYQLNNSYLSRWCFVQKGEPLKRELEAFFDYLRSGEYGSLSKPEDGLETLRVLERYT